jgi:hypothetical protein
MGTKQRANLKRKESGGGGNWSRAGYSIHIFFFKSTAVRINAEIRVHTQATTKHVYIERGWVHVYIMTHTHHTHKHSHTQNKKNK